MSNIICPLLCDRTEPGGRRGIYVDDEAMDDDADDDDDDEDLENNPDLLVSLLGKGPY